MKLKTYIILIFMIFSLSHALGAKNKEFIIGVGGGYSLGKGETLIDFPTDIYFREENKVKNCININFQYFLSPKLGFQVEFSQQKASYFCHLEWYRTMIYNYQDLSYQFIEINYVESPYRKSYSISSFVFSIIYAERSRIKQKFFPFFFLGGGLYFIKGDKDKVLNRFKLGSNTINRGLKAGMGLKYYFSPKKPSFGLSIRLYGVEIKLKKSSNHFSVSNNNYIPFSLEEYQENKRIVRCSGLVKRAGYLGVDISIELRL